MYTVYCRKDSLIHPTSNTQEQESLQNKMFVQIRQQTKITDENWSAWVYLIKPSVCADAVNCMQRCWDTACERSAPVGPLSHSPSACAESGVIQIIHRIDNKL